MSTDTQWTNEEKNFVPNQIPIAFNQLGVAFNQLGVYFGGVNPNPIWINDQKV